MCIMLYHVVKPFQTLWTSLVILRRQLLSKYISKVCFQYGDLFSKLFLRYVTNS